MALSDTSLVVGERPLPPEFPGGDEAMMEFVQKEFKYSHKSPVAGKIYVGFTIDTSGTVLDVHVLRGLNAALDASAVRVVESMPKWKPAIWLGKPMAMGYRVPVFARTD